MENVYHVRNLDLRNLFEDFIRHAESIKKEGGTPLCFDICANDYLKIIQGIASAPELQEKHASANQIQQLKLRIDNMTDFSVSFDSIISEFYYTKSHLIRAFKAEYGISPREFALTNRQKNQERQAYP